MGGGQVSFCPGAQNTLGSPDYTYKLDYINSLTLLSKKKHDTTRVTSGIPFTKSLFSTL